MPILNQLLPNELLDSYAFILDSIPGLHHVEDSIKEDALNLCRKLIRPLVLFQQYEVRQFFHHRLELKPHDATTGKCILSGEVISERLANSKEVIVMICTLGSDIDSAIAGMFIKNPGTALTMDYLGSTAVETLASEACNYFEQLAEKEGNKTSTPLNPGMIGWPIEIGQPQIFSLLDCYENYVSLSDSCMMIPSKSLSLVIGIGPDVYSSGDSCDYCRMKGVCKHKNINGKNI